VNGNRAASLCRLCSSAVVSEPGAKKAGATPRRRALSVKKPGTVPS
jgi:hypothetical protein